MNHKYIDTLVIKIASRCNLNCSYCYMYNKGDLSYLQQPKIISDATIDSIVEKLIDHCTEKEISKFNIVLHGGEPLLAGIDKIKYFVDKANEATKNNGISIKFSVQTNGLLVTKQWCEFFNENKISLGISIDGEKEVNDQFRVDHKGRGSYDKIVKAINLVNKHYSYNKLALLSVLDIDSNPIDSLNHFISLGAKSIDFLLPDNNFEDLPNKPLQGVFANSETPYGDWFVMLYDYWNTLPIDTKPDIRFFHNIIFKFCGITIASDIIGNEENHVLVIETNGDIEPIDSMKICGDSFTKGNVNILKNSLNDAFNLKLASLYYDSSNILSKLCLKCPILDYCGGGFIAHRYSKDKEFTNPTVYCKDYIKFISHIQTSLVAELPEDITNINKIDSINYSEVVIELQIENINFY